MGDTQNPTTMKSYRESHIGSGPEYHEMFADSQRRALYWSIERDFLDEIRTQLFAHREIDLLDFACGTGRILAHLEPHCRSVVGVDVSDSMLAVARRNMPEVELINADLTRESHALKRRRFNLLTAFRFFPNAEQPLREAAIRSLAELLAPDGVLVLNNHRNLDSLNYRLRRWARRRRKRDSDGMDDADVRHLLDLVGLRVRHIYHVGVIPDSEPRPFPFRRLAELIETSAAKLPVSGLSENLVYVCSR